MYVWCLCEFWWLYNIYIFLQSMTTLTYCFVSLYIHDGVHNTSMQTVLMFSHSCMSCPESHTFRLIRTYFMKFELLIMRVTQSRWFSGHAT